MGRVLFAFLMILGSAAWAGGEAMLFRDLRLRQLVRATADVKTDGVAAELEQAPWKGDRVQLTLANKDQNSIHKGRFYRISLVRNYDAINMQTGKKVNLVYSLLLDELDKNLIPTGVSIEMDAKANPDNIVGNFVKYRDVLSSSPTLQAGHAKVGDLIVNTWPAELNDQLMPAYSRFKVVGVTKKYVPLTLYHEYTLDLRDLKTGRRYEMKAPGLRQMPIWAHLVAPENRRIKKMWGMEIHY